jgi:cytochrome c biogenesis protein
LARLGRGLASTRLALALIIILAVLCALGLVIPQAPGLGFGSPEYFRWVEDLGPWALILGYLGFLDMFESPWLIATAALLAINSVACVTRRLLARRMTPAAPGGSGEAVVAGFDSEAGAGPEATAVGRAGLGLGLRSSVIGRAGRHVLHLGVLVVLAGVVVAASTGFQEPFFVVTEGGERAVGRDTGLVVRLASLETDYYQDGTPKEYRSLVQVTQGDGAQIEGVVAVNRPLAVGGVRLFQAGLGPAPELLVTRSDGSVLYHGVVALAGLSTDSGLSRPTGVFRMVHPPLDVRVVGSVVGGDDPDFAPGEIALEFFEPGSSTSMGWTKLKQTQTAAAADISFTYAGMRSFTVLRVTEDPGRLVVWSGCGLFLLGLVMTLFWPGAGRAAPRGSKTERADRQGGSRPRRETGHA